MRQIPLLADVLLKTGCVAVSLVLVIRLAAHQSSYVQRQLWLLGVQLES